jgi:two-component system cell cycle sensor histidine kinase/response regulator CckA
MQRTLANVKRRNARLERLAGELAREVERQRGAEDLLLVRERRQYPWGIRDAAAAGILRHLRGRQGANRVPAGPPAAAYRRGATRRRRGPVSSQGGHRSGRFAVLTHSSQPTVLNVDHNDAARSALSRVLRQAGFEVREAATAAETLSLAILRPDFVLLGVQLPDGDGFEVCRRLKADPATAGIPVLLVSAARLSSHDRVHRPEGGADAYLVKPVEPEVVVAQVRALLRTRQAEEALRESEASLRRAFRAARMVSWAYDPKADRLTRSENAAEVFGFAFCETAEQCWAVVHPDDMPAHRARVREALEARRPYQSVFRYRNPKTGAVGWLEDHGQGEWDGHGNLVRVSGIILDVTERRQAQEAMARDALLLANVRDAVIVTDLDGVVTYWNEGATRLFGCTAAEMLGRPLTGPVPEAARARMAAETRAIRGGKVLEGEWEDYRKDGSRIWVEAHVSRMLDAAGSPVGILALAHDITAKRALEEQYRQAQKMDAIGQLAGGVAHDFNNLLTVINGYGTLVANSLPPHDPTRDLVGEINKAGERAASLTRQLLAFSRKAVLAPKVFDLNALIIDAEKMLRRVIGEDVHLAAQLQTNLGPVRADPGHLEQVLLNLCVNARDAMPRGGKLTVETREVQLGDTHAGARPGKYVLLAVSDTGVGMTEEVRRHLFEPFFTTKEAGKGTGLGLATVHGIVKQSGGHIEVDSEVGVGTTIKVYLPRAAPPAGTGRSSIHGPEALPHGTERLLLVEDDEGVRALSRHILRSCGYTLLEAASGDEALRLARGIRGPIHLLVTDVVMPGLGGRELAERLLESHPGAKVLYLSGYTDDAVVRHGVREVGVQFLQKPYTPAALAQKVREVLDAPGPPALA